MAIVCPNINDPKFKQLVDKVGIEEAYSIWQNQDDVDALSVKEENLSVDTNALMTDILTDLGISVKRVDQLLDENGNKLDAVARASMINKMVEVVEGKADVTTLPEEASHFFVEMLDPNSSLYKGLYSKIDQYPIYQQVSQEYSQIYNDSDDLIRREAMAKLIASEIMNITKGDPQELSRPQQTFLNTWWNKAWQFIKNKLLTVDRSKLNTVSEARQIAEMVLNKDYSAFGTIRSSVDFFQLSNQGFTEEQLKLKDIIISAGKNITIKGKDDERSYYKGDKKLGDSVTKIRDRIFDKRFKNKLLNEAQILIRDIAGAIGNKVHTDLENIAKRILIGDKNVARVSTTDAVTYSKLENYIQKFKKTMPEGTLYLTEQVVYDPDTDTPGTVDLIAITPDGTVHIFDWKTMSMNKMEKETYGEPLSYKTEKYEWQINKYRDILQKYGAKKFGKLRYIPFVINYKKDANKNTVFGSIEVGDAEGTIGVKRYLNPVPSSIERTDNEQIDNLLVQLNALHKELSDTKKEISTVEKERKKQRLISIKKAIRNLQIKQSFTGYIDNGKIEMKTIDLLLKSNAKTPLTEKQLVDMLNHLSVYLGIGKKLSKVFKGDNIDDTTKAALALLQQKAEQHEDSIKDLLKTYFQKAALEAGVTQYTIDHINEVKPASNMLSRFFTPLSRIDHPLFRTLWNLVNKANVQTKKAIEETAEEIKVKTTEYIDWANRNGYTGADTFKPLVDRKTGKMISKFSPEFYKLKKEKIDQGDHKWIKDNVILDKDRLDKYIKEQEEFIKTHTFSTDAAYNKTIRKTKLEELYGRFDVTQNETAWLNPDPWFTQFYKPKETWYSKEYKYLLTQPKALEFFNYFTNKIKEYSEFMPLGAEGKFTNPERFIPSIEKDLIERISDGSGSFGVKDLGQSFIEMFEYKAGQDNALGQINEITGEYKRTIPNFYTSEMDPAKKSYDLGSVLMRFTMVAMNYKHMSEIEGTVQNLQQALRDSNEIVVDGGNQVTRNVLNNEAIKTAVSSENITLFNDFVNYYVYGIKNKDKYKLINRKKEVKDPVTGEVTYEDVNYSWNKIGSKFLRYVSAKALGLNLLSGFANAGGGLANTFITAYQGNFFTLPQWTKAMGMATAGNFNPEVRMILKVLNMTGERDLKNLVDDVSVNNLIRQPSFDDIFFLQSKTDELVYNVAALSLLQNYGIDANGKLKRLDKLPESTKSLMESIKIKDDGKLNLTDLLSNEEFRKFRNKAQAIGEKMIGMSTRDNVSLYRMTMFGQALMQFRGWIPRTLGARFGEVRYDHELEVVERGRYVSLFQQILNKRMIPLILELLKTTFNGELGSTTKNMVAEMYRDYLLNNPAVDKNEVTLEMFEEMHLTNLRAGMMEIALILFFFTLLAGIKDTWEPPEDDEEKRIRSFVIRLSNRYLDELMFYVNPDSMMAITRGLIPAAGFFSDLLDFISGPFAEAYGLLTDDEELVKDTKVIKSTAKMIPGGNTMYMWFGDLSNSSQ